MNAIRNYLPTDREAIEQICLMEPSDNPAMNEALLTTFCHYYLDEESEHCFVATDGNDKAVGYILCAPDFERWKKIFGKTCILSGANPIATAMAQSTMAALTPYAKDYPAHLHIDLLPEYQGKHLGTRLITVLKIHLQSLGVPGLMLDVAKDNIAAQEFYRKNGFHTLSCSDQECTMGIRL